MKKSYIFLLGGQDLEMLEIEKLLKEKKEKFINKKLEWGAKWESYSEIFNNPEHRGKTFAGIELGGKEKMPEGAVDIDHHNFNSDKPSSIEQVAKLLGVELTRWQKLVAANDRGYIGEMEKMCATHEEIKKVRQADKKAQGVTEEDEELAKESIEKHLKKKNGFTIIESLTDKFSTITDLMYGKTGKLIVYNDKKLTWYGVVTDDLIKRFEKEINTGKAYYGGKKANGFFGLAKGEWTKVEIEKIIDEIVEIINKDTTPEMFSYHIFLFPFRWKNAKASGKYATFNEKYNLIEFEESLIHDEKDSLWKRSKFSLPDGSAYNEYNYFFDFVREVLYDQDENLKTESTENNDKIIRHFEYAPAGKTKGEEPLYYNINVKGETYTLEIDSILLNVYGTGTGTLSFHLRNRKYAGYEDILTINKFGRRLFPPFFILDGDGIKTGREKTDPSGWLKYVYDNELPKAIWISGENKNKTSICENWKRYTRKETFEYGPFTLPNFISGLFPENFFSTHEKNNKDYKVYLRPVLDDRMYVISWYGNDYLARTLAKISYNRIPDRYRHWTGRSVAFNINKEKALPAYKYEKEIFWHNYIFVDTGDPTFQNKLKLPELLKNHTYDRWVDYKTLYGMSRYSLVMLTEKDAPSFLIRHLQTLYYKMAELSLLQRSSVISFSDEVTHVSDLVHSDDYDEKEATKKIEDLYKHYLLFANKIYFREITAQEQGIEMYDMMQKIMRIPEQVKDLDGEIAELNQMAQIISEKNEQKEMKKHTWLATIFLPFMLVSGILGMAVFEKTDDIPKWFFSFSPIWKFWFPTILVLIITIIFTKIYVDWIRSIKRMYRKIFKKR